MMAFPCMQAANTLSKENANKRLLIVSEGFESRCISWIKKQPYEKIFDESIICKYEPEKKGNIEAVEKEVSIRCNKKPNILCYNRFAPAEFEQVYLETIASLIKRHNEVIVDISVMSKLLIMIIVNSLKKTDCDLRIVYSEPETWSPSKETYEKYWAKRRKVDSFVELSSIGVYDLIRTPGLTSIVMQDAPSVLVTFTTSNVRLISSLLNEVTPSKTYIINATNQREEWRAKAAMEMQEEVAREHGITQDDFFSIDLLNCKGVFERIASIYKDNCYTNRVILSPIGGKVHAVACAIMKCCCPDVHVEYPTPESYIFEMYSSKETHAIHEICFPSFAKLINSLAIEYELNG